MHKLKNKHTGEIITTPYMAEVEEYLKSGDYEMKNEYPYIGKAPVSGYIVLFLAKDLAALIDGNHSQGVSNYVNYWVESRFTNITREYLANTYGKCESQEHADFICKLSRVNGFGVTSDYCEEQCYFKFDEYGVDFYSEQAASRFSEKLINLPLPPKKESKMPEEKPVYTKEMQERGELPPVGSEVLARHKGECVKCEVLKVRFNGHFNVAAVMALEEGDSTKNCELFYCALVDVKAIQTIEDELSKIWESEPDKHSIINAIIEKYNITPKEK